MTLILPPPQVSRHSLTWTDLNLDADTIRCNAWAAFDGHPTAVLDAAGEIWLDIVRSRLVRDVDGLVEWLPAQRLAAIDRRHPAAVVIAAAWLTTAAHSDLTVEDVALVALRVGITEVTA